MHATCIAQVVAKMISLPEVYLRRRKSRTKCVYHRSSMAVIVAMYDCIIIGLGGKIFNY